MKTHNHSRSSKIKIFIMSLKCLRSQIYKSRGVRCNNSPVSSEARREELIKKIQEIVLNTVKSAASPSGIPSFELRRQTRWKDCQFNERLQQKGKEEVAFQEIKYSTHRKRFEILFNLLSKIYRLLITQSSVTKRELYYEHTSLFGKQSVVDAALLDICELLEASPWELRVFSTSKGLVAGDLKILTADREVINCSQRGGVLVPQDVKGILKIRSRANYILIVEKDAAFQKLIDDGADWKYGPCILITGKGEPDISTRLLVRRLTNDLRIPVFILVDADPYGIEIMCTYRFGSLKLSRYSEELAVSEVRWMGIHPTDIEEWNIPSVPFTNRDFVKTREILLRPYIRKNPQLFKQVNCLLKGGRKCEIENLTAIHPKFLTDRFLYSKIKPGRVL